MSNPPIIPVSGHRALRSLLAPVLLIALAYPLAGCDALNPAFVQVVLPADSIPPQTTDNPSGHVPIFFVSNARFDGALLEYMENEGLDVSDPNLRPRIRVRVQVTFSDGSQRSMEFLDGAQISQAATVIDGGTETAIIPPDLNKPALNNQVAQCDVSAISIVPERVEVYIPVFWGEFEQVEIQDVGLQTRLVQVFTPQFVPLQVDDVDDNLNIVTLRNFGIRDVPGPILSLTCGSVVMFSLEGTLAMPFVGGFPGYFDDNAPIIAAIPGRYEIQTQVR